MCNDTYNLFSSIICLFVLIMFAFLMTVSDPEAARSGNSKITTTLGLVVHAAGNEGLLVRT